MPTRKAEATWEGDLKGGKGTMKLQSGAFSGGYSFQTRFEDTPGTNPEELIGAAHAGCYSMALSHLLASNGHTPQRVHTEAAVRLEKVEDGFKITQIKLTCRATIPGTDEATFKQFAEQAKTGCPVSRALAATPIELDAKLE